MVVGCGGLPESEDGEAVLGRSLPLEEASLDVQYAGDPELTGDYNYWHGPLIERTTLTDGTVQITSLLENPPIVGQVDMDNVGYGPALTGFIAPTFGESQEYGDIETRWIIGYSDAALTSEFRTGTGLGNEGVFWSSILGDRRHWIGLWLDPPSGGVAGFTSPAINLPPDHSPVYLSTTYRGGDVDDVVWSTIGKIRVQLNPDTLVLPVHVRHFYHASSHENPAPLSPETMRALFDAGVDPGEEAASGLGARHHLEADLWSMGTGTFHAENTMGAVWPATWRKFNADTPWAQCGIQFRVESAASVENLQLADWGWSQGECAGGSNVCENPDAHIRAHHLGVEDVAANPGLYVYLTGEIYECAGGGSSVTGGVVCRQPPSASRPIPDSNLFAIIDWRTDIPGVIPHELGHMLDLYHTPSSSVNLMSPTGARVDFAILESWQCEQARTIAQQYLTRWGLW